MIKSSQKKWARERESKFCQHFIGKIVSSRLIAFRRCLCALDQCAMIARASKQSSVVRRRKVFSLSKMRSTFAPPIGAKFVLFTDLK